MMWSQIPITDEGELTPPNLVISQTSTTVILSLVLTNSPRDYQCKLIQYKEFSLTSAKFLWITPNSSLLIKRIIINLKEVCYSKFIDFGKTGVNHMSSDFTLRNQSFKKELHQGYTSTVINCSSTTPC